MAFTDFKNFRITTFYNHTTVRCNSNNTPSIAKFYKSPFAIFIVTSKFFFEL